jgi:SAM-dependent methyltransferase
VRVIGRAGCERAGPLALPAHFPGYRENAIPRRVPGNALRGLAAAALLLAFAAQAQTTLRAPDVRYEPSAPPIVQAMIELGAVRPGDVVYDLGCGDGRVVIAAVRERGASGVCVDIDPRRIAEARDNARLAGVAARIRFLNEDLFQTDISDASVVMLFLWPDVNEKLLPKLLRELKPGTRIVSHEHLMGSWKPERTLRVRTGMRVHPVYRWTVPASSVGNLKPR